MSTAVAHAEPTAPSPLVARADEVFARTSPYPGVGFENHCRRLFRFATMLMEQQGLAFDRDLAYAIAMWHDLGIVSEKDEGENYLQRSRALFWRESEGLALPEVDPKVVDECLLYNHRLLAPPELSAPAECFRRAVITEHTHGWARWGLDRAPVRAVYDELPRDNFTQVLVDFTWRTIKREPLTIVHGIFF